MPALHKTVLIIRCCHFVFFFLRHADAAFDFHCAMLSPLLICFDDFLFAFLYATAVITLALIFVISLYAIAADAVSLFSPCHFRCFSPPMPSLFTQRLHNNRINRTTGITQ